MSRNEPFVPNPIGAYVALALIVVGGILASGAESTEVRQAAFFLIAIGGGAGGGLVRFLYDVRTGRIQRPRELEHVSWILGGTLTGLVAAAPWCSLSAMSMAPGGVISGGIVISAISAGCFHENLWSALHGGFAKALRGGFVTRYRLNHWMRRAKKAEAQLKELKSQLAGEQTEPAIRKYRIASGT